MSLFSKTREKKSLDSELSCTLRFTVQETLHARLIRRPWGNKDSRDTLEDALFCSWSFLNLKVDHDTLPQATSQGRSFGHAVMAVPSCLKLGAGKFSSLLFTSVSPWKINITLGLPPKSMSRYEKQITSAATPVPVD